MGHKYVCRCTKWLQTMHFSQGLEKPHRHNCFLRNTFLSSLREACQGTWTDNWNKVKTTQLFRHFARILTQKPSDTRLLSKALKSSWCWNISGFLCTWSSRSSSNMLAGMEARVRLTRPRMRPRLSDLIVTRMLTWVVSGLEWREGGLYCDQRE